MFFVLKQPTFPFLLWSQAADKLIVHSKPRRSGAGATFDWTFFDNSKLINFDD